MTTSSQKPIVHGIFDKATWTITYIVHQGIGTACAIIDSVLDYDPKSGRTTTTSAEKVVEYVKEHQLKVEWILETHAHADHVSAAPFLKKQLGGKIAIGAHITQVQKVFKVIFNLEQHSNKTVRSSTIYSQAMKNSKLANWLEKFYLFPDIPQPAWLTNLAMLSLWVTPCLCLMWEPHVATSQAVMRVPCMHPRAKS